jgi:hypothetical protein
MMTVITWLLHVPRWSAYDISTIPRALWPWWEVTAKIVRGTGASFVLWVKYSSICCLPLPCIHLAVTVLLLSSSTHCFQPVSDKGGEVYCKLTSLDVSTSKYTLFLHKLSFVHITVLTCIILHGQAGQTTKFWSSKFLDFEFLAPTSNLLKECSETSYLLLPHVPFFPQL